MRRLPAVVVLLAVLLWVCGPALAAEKLAPLDAEFLEYLGSFGGDEEGWELPAAKEPAAKRDGSKTEAASKPAEKR